jgi:hypothetical protein
MMMRNFLSEDKQNKLVEDSSEKITKPLRIKAL